MSRSDDNRMLRALLPRARVSSANFCCLVALLFPLLVSNCSGGGGGQGGSVTPTAALEPTPAPFAELVEQGVDRYLGRYTPMLSVSRDGMSHHDFGTGIGTGPRCYDGSEYRVSTRDTGGRDLLIFLQGGGTCWSRIHWCKRRVEDEVAIGGILDPSLPANPLKDWNVVNVPYCDGSHFCGDVDHLDQESGETSHQHGLRNLSAALDLAANLFPAPRRIVLAGISAGGYGSTYAVPLTRLLYPEVPITVLNDSGIGIFEPGVFEAMLSEWGALPLIPASCAGCLGRENHMTPYYRWILRQDPLLRMAFMSYREDGVVAEFFGDLGMERFAQELGTEMAALQRSHPARVDTFLVDGAGHTMLIGDLQLEADGESLADWLQRVLSYQ